VLTIRISRRVAFLVVLGVFLAIPAGSWASHRFTDVPDSNIFHDDIGWLADAGVTRGCNPPANDEFCPDDAVTRAQMAAFMRRLAEGRVVDAATVQGLDPGALEGSQGPEGPAGPQGPAGPSGPRGFSAWDTIPSGVTVTGNFFWDARSDTDNEDYAFDVALPAKAPVALTDAKVNFAQSPPLTADGDPQCTGSFGAPTAPPGKVCIYVGNASRADGLKGETFHAGAVLADQGFIIHIDANGTGDMYVTSTWAYTAP
jgi:hypothetical protein